MRRTSRSGAAVLLIATLATLPASLAGAAASHPTPAVTFNGKGLTTLRLGTAQSVAVVRLGRLLGAPTAKLAPTPDLKNCGVTAFASWHSLSAYFDRGRLVGLSAGPGRDPQARTATGLRIGDTLARARQLYGRHLTTSGNNGGSWYARTPSGRIDGFLGPSGSHSQLPTSRIITIDVGVVGCPAMSP